MSDADSIADALAERIRIVKSELARLEAGFEALSPPPPVEKPRKRRARLTEEEVRDAFIALDRQAPGDSFAMGDVARVLGMAKVSPGLSRTIKVFAAKGALVAVPARQGKHPRFRYVSPKGDNVVTIAPRMNSRAPRIGSGVKGTGKSRVSRKEVSDVLAEARRAGLNVQKSRGGHWRVRGKGGKVVVVPSTPSDHRSLENVRSQMRKLVAA